MEKITIKTATGERRIFTDDFKRETVARWEKGEAITALGKDLDIVPGVIRGWIKPFGTGARKIGPPRGMSSTKNNATAPKPSASKPAAPNGRGSFASGLLAGLAFRDVQEATHRVMQMAHTGQLGDEDVKTYVKRVRDALAPLEK